MMISRSRTYWHNSLRSKRKFRYRVSKARDKLHYRKTRNSFYRWLRDRTKISMMIVDIKDIWDRKHIDKINLQYRLSESVILEKDSNQFFFDLKMISLNQTIKIYEVNTKSIIILKDSKNTMTLHRKQDKIW